jgi:Tfp pilus assembly protein PilF
MSRRAFRSEGHDQGVAQRAAAADLLSQLYGKYLKKAGSALKYAEQAVALAPGQVASHLAVYELHSGCGRTKKAEQALERAAKTKPRTRNIGRNSGRPTSLLSEGGRRK